jgi:gamma-glutamyl:cysteine ligase YbdK (ATP-grasp superfamily)
MSTDDYDMWTGLSKENLRLKKENEELRLLLEGANATCNKIAEIVGDTGQYRDLVEAVEMKIHIIKGIYAN